MVETGLTHYRLVWAWMVGYKTIYRKSKRTSYLCYTVCLLPYSHLLHLEADNRYSEEFKYRPAASPVITETLKDGRLRIRGASVGALGVREEDIPETPAEKKAKEEKRRKEAREAAKAKLGLKPRKAGKAKKTKKKVKSEY